MNLLWLFLSFICRPLGRLSFCGRQLSLEHPLPGIFSSSSSLSWSENLKHFIVQFQTAQMYQWFEMEDSKSADAHGDHDGHAGGHTSYSYATDWIDHLVDSEQFYNSLGHHNPETWPVNSSVGCTTVIRPCRTVPSDYFCTSR